MPVNTNAICCLPLCFLYFHNLNCMLSKHNNILLQLHVFPSFIVFSQIKEKLSDHGGKLQEAQELLYEAQGKTRQAGALAQQNHANLTALEVHTIQGLFISNDRILFQFQTKVELCKIKLFCQGHL